MPPKRPAPDSAAAAAPKKAKAAATKAAPKAKAATKKAAKVAVEEPKSAIAAVGDKIKKGAKAAVAEVAAAVDAAGELLVDDVAPSKPSSKASAKATPAPVKAVKKAGKKAAAEVGKAVETAGELLVDDVSPPATKKGKKAAAAPVSTGKKRKTADDFMEGAAEAASAVVDKVGEALSSVVKDFGEGSGLAKKAEPKAKKPKAEPKAAAKGKKAAKEPTPEAEAESDNESFIGGFETDDDMGGADSSDDESDADDEAIRSAHTKVDISRLPTVAKDDKTVAQRLKKASKKRNVERGTLFLGRIPHGFYEAEMKEYFGQFGDVTRLRLARNPKTGASRHYAYIEMSSLPVAEIVAETMNNYLLMGHLLQCNVIPADEVHAELWVGANKKFRKVPRARLEKVRNDKPRTAEQQERANKQVLDRQEKRRQKIKAAGIDYEFEGHN